MSYFFDIVKSIERHEGFRSKPYPDPLALAKLPEEDREVIERCWKRLRPTYGHGLTYITAGESEHIILGRVKKIAGELIQKVPRFLGYPVQVKMVLIEMAYQMGVGKLLKFEKMFEALNRGDYHEAALQVIRSKLHEQTTSRADEYALRLEGRE